MNLEFPDHVGKIYLREQTLIRVGDASGSNAGTREAAQPPPSFGAGVGSYSDSIDFIGLSARKRSGVNC